MNAAPLQILAVDKEQLLLCALERACKGRTFEIKTAATPEQAHAEIALRHFDLFLLELDMHDEKSLELLKTVDEFCPYIPIIVMTCSSMSPDELSEIIKAVRKKGSWHLLEKPFSLDKMLGFVADIFHDRENVLNGLKPLTHNYDNEGRDQFRRPYVQPVSFSFKKIINGAITRITAKGTLTDISDGGSGMLAHEPMQPEQVISFEDNFVSRTGIVAWSVMIAEDTCRFGVQFC